MTVDVNFVITCISVGSAVVFGYIAMQRNKVNDAAAKSTEIALLDSKLDNIGSDVSEIKHDSVAIKNDLNRISERLVLVEQSAKSAHHRIDSVELSRGKRRKRVW